MSESTGYEGHWPPRPVKDVVEGQVVQFPAPVTGHILTGTVCAAPGALAGLTTLIKLEDGEYTWAWVHELSEKENVEPHNPWRELWEQWFDFSGDPCEEIYPGGPLERTCFFCGNQRGHCPDCVYLKAKQLLDEEAT